MYPNHDSGKSIIATHSHIIHTGPHNVPTRNARIHYGNSTELNTRQQHRHVQHARFQRQ